MARRKTGDKKVTGREVDIPKVQADDHSIAIDTLDVGGNVGGDIRIGHTIGYTADQVSVLLKQITTTLEPKKFDGRCPYKGLDVFEEEDAELFFGRERLVNELVGRVKESRTVFITGPSGSGKSSLVRAGLIHTLKMGAIKSSDRWFYETMKPGREPIKDLALAFSRLKSPELQDYFLAHMSETDILNKCAESVLSGLKDQRFLLFIDQFEEIFTQISGEDERVAFINMLAHAATIENGRVIVLFAMRSDFVSNCATYPALNEMLSQEFRQIGAMQPEELVSAIALPARHVGLPIEDELIARIINDMKGEPGALPLMQFALKDLFDSQQEKGGVIALTLKDYLQHGGIHKSLERHADKTFAKLSESEQELARTIFSGLIEIGRGTQDTKRTALFDELVPANTKADDVQTVVQKLADARLIITDEQAGKDTVTISHEKLIEAWPWLKKLVNENRDSIALQNEIANDAKEWEDHRRDPSYLYTGARMANAREKLEANKIVLSGLASEFVNAGQAQQRRSQRTRILGVAIPMGLVTLAIIVVSYIVNANSANLVKQSAAFAKTQEAAASTSQAIAITAQANAEEAQRQTRIARAGELAAQAESLIERNFQSSILLGIESLSLLDNARTRGVGLDTLNAYPHLLQYLTHHKDAIYSVAFSPDGKTLASGSSDDSIILWSVATHQPLGQPLKRHTGAVLSVAFSPDGKTLASGSFDTTIILWDLTTHQPLGQPLKGHTGPVSSVAFSPDGKTLASGSFDTTIILWDLTTHQPLGQPLKEHTGPVLSVAFSPDGKTLASGSNDTTIILWDLTTHQPLGQPLKGHTGPVSSVAFSPDGKTLASGSFDTTIILWDLTTHQLLGQPLKGHTDWVNSVTFSPDGKTLASGSIDGTIILWSVATHQPLGQPLIGHTTAVLSVAFSPDGKTLASGSNDDSIILWNVATHQPLDQPLNGHTSAVVNVAFSPDGKTLASGSYDNTIILWDVATHQPLGQPLKGHTDQVNRIAFSPDGKTLASGSDDNTIILWDVATHQPLDRPLTDHTSLVVGVAFSPDGKTLASGDVDGTIRLWDLTSHPSVGEPLTEDTIPAVLTVAFSPDGKTLASGGFDGIIRLWDLTTHQPLGQPLKGHTDRVFNVTFSPDGKTLASGSDDTTIILWDVATHQPLGQPLKGHTDRVIGVAFGPDGKTLASGSSDTTIILWDLDPQSWIQKSCQRAGRNFTRAEWTQYFPNEDYRATCPQWPLEPEGTPTASPTP